MIALRYRAPRTCARPLWDTWILRPVPDANCAQPRAERSRSRDAVFCSHPRHEARHCQKRRRALDLRRMTTGGKSGSPRSETAQDRLQIFQTRFRQSKEAERRQTRVYLLALRQARTLQGALACRRSTAALPLGLTHPKVRRRTRFRGVGAKMAGVSRRRQPRFQRAPRTPVIVPADLMSNTARVQRGRTLCARAPHPAPASRSHRLTSLHEEREDGAFIPIARQVKPNHSRC